MRVVVRTTRPELCRSRKVRGGHTSEKRAFPTLPCQDERTLNVECLLLIIAKKSSLRRTAGRIVPK